MNTIEVKQEHIDRGSRGSAAFCPVALALKDRGYRQVSAGMKSITWRPSPNVLDSAVTPLKARQFMSNFDEDLKVAPFNFRFKEIK